MDILKKLLEAVPKFLPALGTGAVVTVVLWFAHWVLLRRRKHIGQKGKVPRQAVMIVLVLGGIVCVVLALPMQGATRGQLLSLVGVVSTAVIALSSTTFVANAMASLMLRGVDNFRPGDFVRVGDHFGRVTERGLFRTEIQTEDRDLTTIPNLHLVSHPLTVVRASGTIVSAKLSLGYDVAHARVRPLLEEAAERAGLQNPFVRIVELGDFSVTYRVAGFLAETKQLLTTRSKLREWVLDTLHGADVEIVSPGFVNQRRLPLDVPVVPASVHVRSPRRARDEEQAPEGLIFDKADEAQKIEQLRARRSELVAEIKELEARLAEGDERERTWLTYALEHKRTYADFVESELTAAEKRKAEDE